MLGILCCSVTKLCPTLSKPMDCSPPGSSAHGIFQAIIQEWVVMPSSGGSPWPRDRHMSLSPALAGRFFTTRATREALAYTPTPCNVPQTYKHTLYVSPTGKDSGLYKTVVQQESFCLIRQDALYQRISHALFPGPTIFSISFCDRT